MDNGKEDILIVDDQPTILLGFKNLLSSPNLTVDTAENLEEAMNSIKKKHYKVILTDLRLTGATGEEGLEILKYVKKVQPETPVILITGYGAPGIKEKAFSLGASHYLEKPVFYDHLQMIFKSLGIDYF